MIDIEPEVYSEVASKLYELFPGVTVESAAVYSPAKLPCACIEETDNYSYQLSRDSASNENHATVVYEANVYSNRTGGKKKKECRAIMAVIDEVLTGLGFTCTTKTPINLDDATKYRMFARYTAVVSKNKVIYRR